MTTRSILVAAAVLCVAAGTAFAAQQRQIHNLRSQLAGSDRKEGTGVQTDDEDLDRRIAMLEDRVARLTKIALDNRSMAQSSSGVTVASEISDDEVAALRDDIDSLSTGELFSTEEGREKFRAAVREEQEQIMEERRQERFDRMRREYDAMVDQFIADAGLDDDQAQVVRDSIATERETAREIFEAARAGDLPFRDARQQFEDAQSATDDAIASVLDQEQYAAYSELRNETRWGGRRR